MSNQLLNASFNRQQSINKIETSLERRLEQLHPKKIDLSLDRILNLLSKLNNPQNEIKNIIHIAGTNGKGSVLAFLRAFLKSGNYSVNTYSSPHLINFNERINLNGKNISNKYLEEILKLCNINFVNSSFACCDISSGILQNK